jgi:hypothetical protein
VYQFTKVGGPFWCSPGDLPTTTVSVRIRNLLPSLKALEKKSNAV